MTDLVELKSLLDTRERPFVVIGRDFEVVAVNQAYDQAVNRAGAELVGQKCHQVLHHREHPCSEMGEAGYLSRMLREHGGNRRRSAKAMGISERKLYRRLAE